MARRIQHRSEFGFPAERVRAALTDEGYLRERLARIGGRSSALVSHEARDGVTRIVMRQGIDAEHLPSAARRLAPNGVTIERTEVWNGRRATVTAAVAGLPGSLTGAMALDDAEAGSVLAMDGEVKVSIPLVGGKLEGAIADQLGTLFGAEARFTNRWLTDHPA